MARVYRRAFREGDSSEIKHEFRVVLYTPSEAAQARCLGVLDKVMVPDLDLEGQRMGFEEAVKLLWQFCIFASTQKVCPARISQVVN